MEGLRGLGGVEKLAKTLHTDTHRGLDATASGPSSVAEHSRVFGANKFKEVPSKNFFVLCWENIQDPIILLLIAAATVS